MIALPVAAIDNDAIDGVEDGTWPSLGARRRLQRKRRRHVQRACPPTVSV
jgi:hypothetical protein